MAPRDTHGACSLRISHGCLDLRHSAATLLLGQGVHPKIVAELLGHSRIGATLDTSTAT
ncbi:MAG: hypothetical protein ACYDEB_02110 [Dehalococcoidia bacterium]